MRISRPRSLFFVLFAVTGCGLIVGTSDDYPAPIDASVGEDGMVPKGDSAGGSAGHDATGEDTGPLMDGPLPPDDAPDAPNDSPDDAPDGPEDAPADSPDDVVEAGGDGAKGPEDCTNGKDDNGDGLVDCADPECQPGFTCGSPLLPKANGWTVGLFDETGRPPCPTGYDTPQSVIDGLQGAGPASCNCQCDTNTPSHCAGTAMHANNGGGGNACPSPPNQAVYGYEGSFAGGVVCALPNSFQPVGAGLKFATAGDSHTVPGSCTPHDVATIPTVSANHGETCSAVKAGAGCGGGVCLPQPGGAFQICAFKAGKNACPNGLVQKSVSVGDGVNDPRGCGGCACGTSDLQCTFTGIQFYPNGTCAPGPGAFYVQNNGGCYPANPSGNFSSLGVLGTQNNNSTECHPQHQSQTNNLTASPAGADVTICCPP